MKRYFLVTLIAINYKMVRKKFNSVDEYINDFPVNTQEKLNQIRKLLLNLLPEAKEMISYQIPAYKINGFVIYFAGFKKHISLYPAPRNNEMFKELDGFKGGKGTVQFPLGMELPIELITKIVNFRKQEDSKNKIMKSPLTNRLLQTNTNR